MDPADLAAVLSAAYHLVIKHIPPQAIDIATAIVCRDGALVNSDPPEFSWGENYARIYRRN
jgi:hypothetical protein